MDNLDDTATLREGITQSLFVLTDGVYIAETGEYAALVRTVDNTFTLTSKDGVKKTFNAIGQIAEITDLNGNSLFFNYNPDGNLATVTDGASRTTIFAYDADNQLTAITDPAGGKYTFTYDGKFLTAIIWPDSTSWQYNYDANGFMLSKADPLGYVTTYTYDSDHRVSAGTNSAGSKSLVYPVAATTIKSTTFTQDDGGIWVSTYDSHNGLLTQKTDPLGAITTYRYDANRNLIGETAPDSGVTSYTYDSTGNRLSMTDALGHCTTYTYNSLNQIISTTDALGQTTTNSYDDKGRLTKTVDPLGAATTFGYDIHGNLIGSTNALKRTSTFGYDAAGNKITSTDPSGTTTTFTYDGLGNMLTQTDALGKMTTFEYDGRYRLTRVTDPMGNATSYAYDLMGNKTGTTDANGNVTSYGYDGQGRLVKSTDAAGFVTTYAYSATGCPSCGGGTDKLTSLTDAKGQTTGYQYDLLGRIIKETDPLGMVTASAYDAAGNLITKTDANGATVNYTYDLLKRLTGKRYPDGSSVSFTYDAAGRVLTATNADVSYAYAYDASGRVTSVVDSRGYTIAYSYDLLGNRSRTTIQPGTADERVTIYKYDANGRLTGITAPAGTFIYSYDKLGRRTSLSYPNQINTGYSYDGAGRLTSLSNGTVASYSYTLDKIGNRTGKIFTEAERYLYDAIYRLLTVASNMPETYSYDQVGNRMAGPGAKDSGYLYNSGNQMLQGRKLQYGYDNNGNQTTKTVPTATDRTWTQTWDSEDRLIKVVKVKGAEKKSVSFTYDPQGRRIGKQVTTVVDNATRTISWNYFYDDDNIVLEVYIDESGAVTKTFFTHGAEVDEHLALERNGRFYYYHADGLGSVMTVTNHRGQVVQSYVYGSFGSVEASTDFKNSYIYTGREWDKETGLYYYRARYYDPMEGRFISKDPIGFDGGLNAYAYVENNPQNIKDSTGLSPESCKAKCFSILTFKVILQTVNVVRKTFKCVTERTKGANGLPIGNPQIKCQWVIVDKTQKDLLDMEEKYNKCLQDCPYCTINLDGPRG